jgi:hypothetical protein
MHFEILVEDQSGQKMLEILLPKIIGTDHTFRIHPYKGIGHIPAGMKAKSDPGKRILLDQLPKLLRGYGRTFADYPSDYRAAVILVCDLDNRCLKELRLELQAILEACDPRPETRFCIAIEEGEAWLLGDISAIAKAYPTIKAENSKAGILLSYKHDSICGTWEILADALYPGGRKKLESLGWQAIGKQKSEWAERIAPHMNVASNESPSFCYFRNKLKELADLL